MARLLSSLLILLWATTAGATTYYVSPTGSGSNDGLSLSTPWDVFKACATSTITAGDTVCLDTGTYEGNNFQWAAGYHFVFYPVQSGTAGNPIIWRNVPGRARPVIKGDSLRISKGGDTSSCFGVGARSHLVLDSLELREGMRNGVNICGAKNITIRNCYFFGVGVDDSGFNNPGAISCGSGWADSLVVHNCIFEYNDGAIIFEVGIDSAAIYNNTFINNTIGVQIKVSTEGKRGSMVHIFDNVFEGGWHAQTAVTIWAAYVMRDIHVRNNVIYGQFNPIAIEFFHTDVYADTGRHDRVYVYNNTFDGENQARSFCSVNLTDTLNADTTEQYQFLFDTVQVFNNLILNPATTNGARGCFAMFGKMTYGGGVNGKGRPGPALMFDYNGIVDTTGGRDLFLWHQADTSGGAWITGTERIWTHQEFIDSLPLTPFEVASDFAGHGANDTVIGTMSNIVVDRASRDYRLHSSAPNYLKSGGRGGTVSTYSGSVAVPTYIGALDPEEEPPASADTGKTYRINLRGVNIGYEEKDNGRHEVDLAAHSGGADCDPAWRRTATPAER